MRPLPRDWQSKAISNNCSRPAVWVFLGLNVVGEDLVAQVDFVRRLATLLTSDDACDRVDHVSGLGVALHGARWPGPGVLHLELRNRVLFRGVF